MESILIVIVIGFSVDYTVHLADSYMNSESHTRYGKVSDALGHTGTSVMSGAISTLGAAIPMFGAQIIFFEKFGAFVFITIALSIIHALGFFAALLLVIGPLGKQGHLAQYYAGWVTKAHEHVEELEEEQALVDKEKAEASQHPQNDGLLSKIMHPLHHTDPATTQEQKQDDTASDVAQEQKQDDTLEATV